MKIVYTFFIKLPLIALVARASRLRSLAAPARARAPEAVASPNRGLGLASRHPEEIVAGPFLALCAPSGRRRLAEPVEDLHDQGELPLEVRIKLIGVAHGEEPLRQALHGVAQRPLRPRRWSYRYLGPGQPRHDVVLPAHAAPGGHVGDQLVFLRGAAERHRLAALAGAVLARHPIRPSAQRVRLPASFLRARTDDHEVP